MIKIGEKKSLFQFEKKALADALSIYMRGIMGLDDKTRAKIVQPNNPDENFDHLKIECRTQDKHHQHEAFGDQLFHIMKSVKINSNFSNTFFSL